MYIISEMHTFKVNLSFIISSLMSNPHDVDPNTPTLQLLVIGSGEDTIGHIGSSNYVYEKYC